MTCGATLQVEGSPAQLVATGTMQNPNPDRVVLKKIVLSGYPVKVHKKKAVVKYMFFNPEDVKWFRPLDVFTKYGRRGRIKEPVGTHGAMKCVFDGSVQQRDSVCVALYKRVFPKWPEVVSFN
jgi:pre-rRNA-processing protein TSR1